MPNNEFKNILKAKGRSNEQSARNINQEYLEYKYFSSLAS